MLASLGRGVNSTASDEKWMSYTKIILLLWFLGLAHGQIIKKTSAITTMVKK